MNRLWPIVGCALITALNFAPAVHADSIGFDSGTIYAVTDRNGVNSLTTPASITIPGSDSVTQTDAGLQSTTLYTTTSDNQFNFLGYLTLDGLNANSLVASQANLTFTPTQTVKYTFEGTFTLVDGAPVPYDQSWFDVSLQNPFSDLFNTNVASGGSLTGILQPGKAYQFALFPNIEGNGTGNSNMYSVCYSLQLAVVPLPPAVWSTLGMLVAAGAFAVIRRRTAGPVNTLQV